MQKRQLKLGFSLAGNGTHKAGWRLPQAQADIAVDFQAWVDMAKAAEREKIHFIFWADGQAVRIKTKNNEELSFHPRIDQFEPLTLIAALSGRTEHIGFVATASTSYNNPYTIARKYASLDHISGGRVGWNVVTSWSEEEALNFNREKHFEHDERYRRAREFVEVVRGLWDSWDDDAFTRDKASGRYFDPNKLHVLNHKGEFFQVRGPLNIPRPPQGHPVIAQAGGSAPGQDLAAWSADLVYTGQKDFEEAKTFYDSVKGRLEAYGRSRDSMIVMPGVMAIIGQTQAEAEAKCDQLGELLHPSVGIQLLGRTFGDLTNHPLDQPPPMPEDSNAVKSYADAWRTRLEKRPMTVREIYENVAMTAGHRLVVGTPTTVADQLEEWFTGGACDGFNIMAPYMPGPVHEFLDLVVPELRRRGLFRSEYEGKTLRDNLGLSRPTLQSSRTEAAE
jgi:alkanesulfonate monooxygenase